MTEPPGFCIRPATREDLERLIELATEMVVHSISPFREVGFEQVREYRRSDLRSLEDALDLAHTGIFVAEDSGGALAGHVIAMAGQRDSSTGEGQGWVFDLSIRGDCWGRGLGRALMKTAEEFVRGRGYRYLGLGVTVSNQRALRFYREMGYLEERVQMVKKL
ncbi:MAG: GNAT family N-acetyltransferase [Armatimonadetes bacterium]|nr:GNAT family N-acetyltransferase [Armatimonadota bacterium]